MPINTPSVFAYTKPADMRKSFSGLVGIIEQELKQMVESGHLFLFFNRRRNCVKVLYFVGDGLVIFYKRHESKCPLFLLCTRIGERADNLARWLVAASGMDASTAICGPRRWFMHSDVTLVAPPRAHRPTCRRHPIHCGAC